MGLGGLKVSKRWCESPRVVKVSKCASWAYGQEQIVDPEGEHVYLTGSAGPWMWVLWCVEVRSC